MSVVGARGSCSSYLWFTLWNETSPINLFGFFSAVLCISIHLFEVSVNYFRRSFIMVVLLLLLTSSTNKWEFIGNEVYRKSRRNIQIRFTFARSLNANTHTASTRGTAKKHDYSKIISVFVNEMYMHLRCVQIVEKESYWYIKAIEYYVCVCAS